jgi:hypothetical protein
MLTYKNRYGETTFVSFKCRMCKVYLSNPDELRMHSMVKHKGHMLLSTKS